MGKSENYVLLVHLSIDRVSFWDTVMSVVRVDIRDVRPSKFACVHSKGHSFDLIYLKLCQNINLYKI